MTRETADIIKARERLVGPVAEIGSATRIYETESGSTVIVNKNENPINIQLYPSGRAYLSDNSDTTTISTQNEWVPIEGNWDARHLNFLTHDAGSLTYQGDVTTQVQYLAGGSYNSPDNNADYEMAMFNNGTLKEPTIMPFSPARKDEDLSLPMLSGFTDETTTNMSHSVRVRCINGTTDLTVVGLSFTIKG